MKVLIKYGQILLTVVLLVVLAYIGMTWCIHKIGFCLTNPNEDCQGPFYHARHIFGAFIMACVLIAVLFWPVSVLIDRWKKDVEREEARMQERKKEQAINAFRKG